MSEHYSSFSIGKERKDRERFLRDYLSGLGLSFDRLAGCGGSAVAETGPCPAKAEAMDALRREIGECTRCELHRTRTNMVFGVGNPCADVLFVGEAPGEDEDLKGEPFVGRAGRLLDRMLEAIGLSRSKNVYIANVLKSRPPGNKIANHMDSIPRCLPFLQRQIEILSPRVICCLGAVAAQALLKTNESITRLRGHFHPFGAAKLLPTYHPSYLLRNPVAKREAWEDLKKVAAMLKALREEEHV